MKRYLNVLSGIAIVFVVLIHSNAFYIIQLHNTTQYIEVGYFINVLDKIIHIAVPVFIFVSGYKYSLTTSNNKNYLLRRLKSVGILFFAITVTFIIFNMYKNTGSIRFITIIREVIKSILGYNYVYPLWYVPLYFFVLIFYMLLLKRFNNKRVSILVCLISTIYVIIGAFNLPLINLTTTPFNFVYYLIFFDLGYNLEVIEKRISANKLFVTSLWGCSIIVLALIKSNFINAIVYNLITAITGCLVLYWCSIKLDNSKILQFIGKYSVYIFLFHEPFLSKLSSTLLNANIYNNYTWCIIIVIISIIISIIIGCIIDIIKKLLCKIKNNYKM
ncbi:acyltransferase [Clostridium sp.]|uniref:acyltransferase n=1 Tax=Clostridium sp. TaxID=1506 RepID=UPI00321680F8